MFVEKNITEEVKVRDEKNAETKKKESMERTIIENEG